MGLQRRDNTELVLQTLDELKKPKKLTKEEKKAKSFLEKVEFARTESARLYNPDDYRIIRDGKELLEYIELGNKCGYISIDTETTGLEFTDTVVGLCLYVDGEKACYCPYRHIDYFTGELVENQLSKESIIQALSMITANIIMHHADFDIRKILRTFGVRLRCWWDTQIGGYILNENESHKLKDLHGKYVSKQDEATFGDLFNKIGFQYVPIGVGYMYAAHDAIDTRELQQFQAKFLRVDHPREDFRNLYYVFRNIEMAVLDATINMEETGVYLDMPYTESIIPKYEEKLEKALEECYTELLPYKEQCLTHEQLDNPVNLSSPKQVAIVLYDIMKIKPIDGRKVGEEILEKINIPFTKALLAYRGALKLLNTYIKKLPSVRQADDKIHCSFNATGTACITKDSLLLTDSGYMPIGDLFDDNEKDGVFEETDISIVNKDLEYEKVSHRIKYTNVPTIKITTVGGFTIEGTHNHPIIASKYPKNKYSSLSHKKKVELLKDSCCFRRLDELTVGQYVKIPFGYNIFPTEYIKLDLEIYNSKRCKNDSITIPEYVNEEFAELLGMYHADGSLRVSNGVFRIMISNKDESVRDRVIYLVKSLFNLDCFVVKDKRKGVYNTCFSSIALINMSKFLCRGARNKKIPDFIYKSPKSVILAYIKGLTLDSSVDVGSHRVFISIYNQTDARFIQYVLMNIGIYSTVGVNRYSKQPIHDHLGNVVGKYMNNRLILLKEYAYMFNTVVGMVQPRKSGLITSEWGSNSGRIKAILEDKYIYLAIKKIEYGYSDVFDLHVPNTHSFIANGIVNHNTGRYSSNSPNLQNIPSHDKMIRPMFCGGIDYREVDDLTFEKCEEVELSTGEWKFVELLKVGDEVVTDDGVHRITNIEVQPTLLGKVILQLESKD